jgi:predicted alpha/beta-hydrolase family hydrolase
MAIEPMQLRTTDGLTLEGEVHVPEGVRAGAVLAHPHPLHGGNMRSIVIGALFTGLPVAGVATLRFNFPYREQGRKFPDRPPAAIAAWRAAMDAARAAASDGEPVWAAGKSFGGRMASMAVAEGMPATGLVYLGYPLHPPGRPEKLRDEHLYGLKLPMLFLQGTRDTFATPELLERVVSGIGPAAILEWCEGGDHSFAVAGRKRSADEVGASLASTVSAFMRANG